MNDIKIIYEDDDILVLDKPSGITVNKSDTTIHEQTIQDFVENKLAVFKSHVVTSDDNDFYKRAGIVHRIDKETSGILLVAKNLLAFENMQKQFKDRVVKKTYLALAHGKVVPEIGEINVPVGRLPWSRKKFGVLAGGREAITKYKVLKIINIRIGNREEPMSLLELYPETGRTHQIRVHLKYYNHPIFADFLYAGRKTSRDDRKVLDRVFLHAHKISFMHPKTNQQISFESSLPDELNQVIN